MLRGGWFAANATAMVKGRECACACLHRLVHSIPSSFGAFAATPAQLWDSAGSPDLLDSKNSLWIMWMTEGQAQPQTHPLTRPFLSCWLLTPSVPNSFLSCPLATAAR